MSFGFMALAHYTTGVIITWWAVDRLRPIAPSQAEQGATERRD